MNVFLLGCALVLLGSGAAHAAGQISAADSKLLHDYVLTMTKVRAYETATANATVAGNSDPALKAEGEKMSEEPDKTMADIKAKFMRHPRLYAFYAKQGLSMDDAVLIPLSLMGACTVAQYPQIAPKMADSVSSGQVAFCKQNMPALKSMKFFSGGGD